MQKYIHTQSASECQQKSYRSSASHLVNSVQNVLLHIRDSTFRCFRVPSDRPFFFLVLASPQREDTSLPLFSPLPADSLRLDRRHIPPFALSETHYLSPVVEMPAGISWHLADRPELSGGGGALCLAGSWHGLGAAPPPRIPATFPLSPPRWLVG